MTGPLTIGQLRMEWPLSAFSSDKSAYRYMCEETGVGGGSVYYEDRLFASEAEALVLAEAMAATANAALDERDPKRAERRKVFFYQIRSAIEAEHKERTRDAEQRHQRLLERIVELDTYPLAHVVDEDGNETDDWINASLTDEQVVAVQNSLLRGDEKALADLAAYRSEQHCAC